VRALAEVEDCRYVVITDRPGARRCCPLPQGEKSSPSIVLNSREKSELVSVQCPSQPVPRNSALLAAPLGQFATVTQSLLLSSSYSSGEWVLSGSLPLGPARLVRTKAKYKNPRRTINAPSGRSQSGIIILSISNARHSPRREGSKKTKAITASGRPKKSSIPIARNGIAQLPDAWAATAAVGVSSIAAVPINKILLMTSS
jgi:hypothetical protein